MVLFLVVSCRRARMADSRAAGLNAVTAVQVFRAP